MPWKPEYSVNINVIDMQHKKLVDLLNQIHEASRVGKGKEALAKILDDLVTYTKVHFTTEEDFMRKHSYAGYAQHKAEHDRLTQKVMEFQVEFKSGRVALSIEVMQFLKDWLTGHIIGVDKQYTPFLNSKGVR
jgi:hemerythrin-like metal-binding protein